MKLLWWAILLLFPVAGRAAPLWTVSAAGVAVDQTLLDDVFAKSAPRFTLPVEGRELNVQVETLTAPNLGVSSLRGRIDDSADSFFLLCRGLNGATVAFFQAGDGVAYKLDHTQGFDAVRAVAYESLGACAGGLAAPEFPGIPGREHVPARPVPHPDKTQPVADDGSRHDILIAYSIPAMEAAGGFDFIRAEVQLAVDAANQTYANSGIAMELRLVHVMATDFDMDVLQGYDSHLYQLANPTDGILDEVPVMRDLVGADFANLFVLGYELESGEVAVCGIAYLMQAAEMAPEFENRAYSVVSLQCGTTLWSLSHEIGHNRGCAHNREDASLDGIDPYSYGRRFAGTDAGHYRTVMAYNAWDVDHRRIPYFTSPDVYYGGVPTGIAPGLAGEAHNALTHDNSGPLCAGFRSERIFVEFRPAVYSDGSVLFPHPSIGQAITDSRDGCHIVLNNGDPTVTGVLAAPRIYIHDGTGSAVLGGD